MPLPVRVTSVQLGRRSERALRSRHDL